MSDDDVRSAMFAWLLFGFLVGVFVGLMLANGGGTISL